MDHRTIIEDLGGHKALADALGVRENAVCHWKSRGIPPFYWQDIVDLARSDKKDRPTIEMLRSGRQMKHHSAPQVIEGSV
jgi:hypothetical protein